MNFHGNPFPKKGSLSSVVGKSSGKLPYKSIVANGTTVHKEKREGINAVICSAGRGQDRGKIQV
jgi:hypothetical protein